MQRFKRQPGGLLVEKSCAFPRIGKTSDPAIAITAKAGDQSAAKQALKIQDQFRAIRCLDRTRPREDFFQSLEPAKLRARKEHDFIDVPVSGKQRRPFRVDEPSNPALRPMLF